MLNVASTGMFMILALIVNLRWYACKKMNIIAKISLYLERSVDTLKLCKEYLHTVIRNTPVLLRIKYWTVWYVEHYSISTHTGVTNFQKNSPVFLAHPVYDLLWLTCMAVVLMSMLDCWVDTPMFNINQRLWNQIKCRRCLFSVNIWSS